MRCFYYPSPHPPGHTHPLSVHIQTDMCSQSYTNAIVAIMKILFYDICFALDLLYCCL